MKKSKIIGFLGIFLSFTALSGCVTKHSHIYTNPTWNWLDNNTVTASFGCLTCDETFTFDATVSSSITKEASCIQAQETTYVASVELDGLKYTDSKVEYGNKLDHTYGNWTYKDENQHQKLCQCGDTIVENHKWDEGKVTKTPSHLQEGEKIYTCSVCGGTKKETLNKTSEHTFSSWVKDDDKTHSRTCACGQKETKNHVWDEGTITKAATHLAKGEKTYTCVDCKATKVEEISTVDGHTFGDWAKYDETNHKRTCGCGEVEYEAHKWEKTSTTTAPTFGTDGTDLYTCSVCGETKNVVTKSNQLYPFTRADYNALALDSSTEWGDPAEVQDTYGLRNDLSAMKKWSHYTKDGKQDISNKTSTQFIEWATEFANINDGVAEQVFANKVTVSNKYFVFRAGTDSDSNLINIRFNIILSDLTVLTINPLKTEGNVSASTNTGYYTIKQNQWVFGAKLTYDLSSYLNQQVAIVIEVDQPAEYNPTIWLDQMGFYGLTLSRELLGFSGTDFENLALDNSTEWGDPAEVQATYGLRNDLAAMKKWSWYTKAGKQDISNKTNTQFIAWASTPDEINDGIPEQMFVNRVKVSNNYFDFRCGTDSNSNFIKIRFNIINSSGDVITIDPYSKSQTVTENTNGWYTVQEEQWVFGAKITYDLSSYLNQEVGIAIEVEQPAEYNPTIWLCQMGFHA